MLCCRFKSHPSELLRWQVIPSLLCYTSLTSLYGRVVIHFRYVQHVEAQHLVIHIFACLVSMYVLSPRYCSWEQSPPSGMNRQIYEPWPRGVYVKYTPSVRFLVLYALYDVDDLYMKTPNHLCTCKNCPCIKHTAFVCVRLHVLLCARSWAGYVL